LGSFKSVKLDFVVEQGPMFVINLPESDDGRKTHRILEVLMIDTDSCAIQSHLTLNAP